MKTIEVISISKKYRKLYALKEVSLTVEKGDVYGIIGLSGAGKSTLVRVLSRLTKPSSGKIIFQGIDLASLEGEGLRQARQSIGMIFQHFNLFDSRTAAENIAYPLEIGGKESKERVEELLGLVGLSAKKDAYPSQLSGGEKQRVGIARALANHPSLLLCDEATSALDPKTSREILDLLQSINRKLGLTIILIAHDMEVIKRICNKVAVMEEGRIIEEGPVVKIFAEPKCPTTKRFIESGSHEIPPEFFKPPSPNRKLLRLRFKGKAAGEPLIAQIIKRYHVEANILLGWIDKLQSTVIGILIIEITGEAEAIARARGFLEEQTVQCEVLTDV